MVGGPVSAALEADLRDWVRRHGVVLWLDLDDSYSQFVDRLAAERARGGLPYRVHGFRGSHLRLMLALESLAGGVDKTPLVVHLPGFNEEAVRTTPLLELYAAGVRYRKKLDTLVTEAAAGRVKPEQIAAFRQQSGLTLEQSDAWLSTVLDNQDAAGGLGAQLRAMSLQAVVDDLLTHGFVARQVKGSDALDAVWDQLSAWTGLTAEWRDRALPQGRIRPSDVAFAVASWALAVEYVDDLQRAPVDARLTGAAALPGGVIEACGELARHLRERHQTFYKRTADETEGWLTDEVEVAKAEDLGKIDTFRFEEDRVLQAALVALEEEEWSKARDWAAVRVDGGSFWLTDDPSRRSAWQLVQDAARLGDALTCAGPTLEADSLQTAAERYRSAGCRVDQAHRHLEQRRTALLYPQVPEFETLRARLDLLRDLWRNWADEWARDFSALCRSQGFLPPSHLQQRTLFEDVVRPMTQEAGTTALFVVDAFRFEMGEELFSALAGTPATTLHLKPRFAELPTVTEVGMNVLAPVAGAGGTLRPAMSGGKFKGFSTGEFRVSDPETRKRAMHDRVGGATCPWLTLSEVVSRDTTSLKQALARARLVVVHSQEIDNAGEKGVGPAVFDHVMQKLRAAWRLLREAGVRRFVVTADHGFLLLDETARNAQSHGRKIDPKRRHTVSPVPADHTNEARVPLEDLGYVAMTDQLMFPVSTAVFDTGRRNMSFVHGGNSLQERVIPVLTLVHRAAAGGDTLRYIVAARAKDAVGGMHCLTARLEVTAQGALAFGGTREVELGIEVVDAPDVHVELCQTRGGARLAGGAVQATVDEEFEVFFRLSGPVDARVQVRLHHGAAEVDVEPCVLDARFDVAVLPGTAAPAEQAPSSPGRGWLADLPSEGVRQLFEHLAAHGVVTEDQAAAMLGGQRAVRRFSRRFEEFAARAPFAVRIDVVSGVKRYVREGNE